MSRKQQFTGKHVTILEHIIIREQFIWLMTNEDTDIVNKFVDFIKNNYNLRKVSTNNI